VPEEPKVENVTIPEVDKKKVIPEDAVRTTLKM
jgi:hypothetical protein